MPDTNFNVDYFDSRFLTGVINKRPLKHGVFTSFFKRLPPSATENFELHVKTRNITMLPAITNVAPGTMRKGDLIETGIVKAPRFRPKREFKAADRFKQPAGVNPYEPLENAQERAIAEDQDLHRQEIDFSIEVMCQQAMVTGKVTLYDMVEGNKPVRRFEVDYLRPEKNAVVLSGASLWSDPTSDLIGMVDDWGLRIQEETSFTATDLLLGKNAYKYFRKHDDVRKELDNRRVEIGGMAPHIAKKIKGYWNGLNIWALSQSYTDIDGVVKPYLDPDCALLVTSDAESVIHFGLPADNDCVAPVEVFSKMYKDDDPSGIFSIAECRPLAWTKQPGWTVLAKVA